MLIDQWKETESVVIGSGDGQLLWTSERTCIPVPDHEQDELRFEVNSTLYPRSVAGMRRADVAHTQMFRFALQQLMMVAVIQSILQPRHTADNSWRRLATQFGFGARSIVTFHSFQSSTLAMQRQPNLPVRI
jgi:hypothetical protein